MALRHILDAFNGWVGERRPMVEKLVKILPTLVSGNTLLWWDALPPTSQRAVANDLIMCRWARAPHYDGLPALVRQLVQLDGDRDIPGERPLTMAEQRARRAKPKEKPRAAAPRRPPQDPAPLQERRFGVCQRCKVCLAYDVNEGCCTVCSRPLTRMNPHDNPGMRRFKDPGEATRHADRAAKRSDTPQYVYALSSNPKFAVLPEGHPVQYGIEQGTLNMGAVRLIHTATPGPAPNPHRKRRKKKAKSSREGRRARLRRLLRI